MPFWTHRLIRTLVALALILVVTFLFVLALLGDPARAILGPQASADSATRSTGSSGSTSRSRHSSSAMCPNWFAVTWAKSISQGVSIGSLMWSGVTPRPAAPVRGPDDDLFTFPLAVLAAVKRGSALDHTIRIVPLVGLGLPAFWFSLMLINYLAVKAAGSSRGGYGDNPIEHLLLAHAAGFRDRDLDPPVHDPEPARRDGRLARGRLRGSCTRPRRAGAARPVRLRRPQRRDPGGRRPRAQHGLAVGNTLIVEKVFAIPGIGSLLIDATLSRDFPVVQGLALVIAILVIVTNILTELTRILLDPSSAYPKGSMR